MTNIANAEKGLEQAAEQRGFERGWAAAMDRRKMYVDFETEKAMPVDWDEYTDDYEREVIANMVEMTEFQEYFKRNLVCQAMLKWRQARLSKSAEQTHLLFEIGNAIMELVEFYEHAKDGKTIRPEPTHGFDSILSEDSA